MRLREQRQAAFGDEPHAAGRHDILDGRHVVVEADAEIRVMPGDTGPLQLAEQEAEIGADLLEGQRLIVDDRIDAEAAGVGASHAADHRHDLEGRRLGDGLFDEPPALREARQLGRLAQGADLAPDRPVRGAIVQHVGDRVLVGEAQHIVEVAGGVLRVAAGVRPAEHGDGAAPTRQIADGIGGLCRTGEGPDDQDVRIVLQLAPEILGAGVADIADVMAQLLAPRRHDLGHDAREVGIHDAAEEIALAALADEVENGDLEARHDGPFHEFGRQVQIPVSARRLASATMPSRSAALASVSGRVAGPPDPIMSLRTRSLADTPLIDWDGAAANLPATESSSPAERATASSVVWACERHAQYQDSSSSTSRSSASALEGRPAPEIARAASAGTLRPDSIWLKPTR